MLSLEQDEHAKQLLDVLNNLLSTKEKNIAVNVFDCRNGYVIHLIPTNVHHPLKDIVNTVKKQFFLVSKLPNTGRNSADNSIDEEKEAMSVNLPELHVVAKQHVFVGTPISQQVYHLFWEKNLHDSEAEIVENCLDTNSLMELELKDARYLASLYTQGVKNHDLPEIWFLCNRASPQYADFMGVVPCAPTDLQCSGKELSTVMIRSEDYNEKKEILSLNHQKKYHMKYHRVNQAETHGFARYNLYGIDDLTKGDADEPQSSIAIEFAWDGVREYLQPPPSSSNAVLKICAHPEDVHTILPAITNELNVLGEFFATVEKERLVGKAEQSELEEEFDRANLKKNVLEFLDKLRLESMGQEKETESVSTTPSATISFGVAEGLDRKELDNTESLWLFLKELPSTSQMTFCLEVVLEQLFLGEYQPVLYANNQTGIGSLLKEAISCSTDKERAEVKAKIKAMLTPSASLQAVVDIGIDKLQNDYINYFVKQELVTKDLLEYFISKVESPSVKLQRLLKLHCILSLVTLATSYARINLEDLRRLVPSALKFYENHSHVEIPIFSLSLPAFSTSSSGVKNTCVRQFQPQSWVTAITSPNQITIVQFDAKDQLDSFAEGNTDTFRGDCYSIKTAIAHKVVCI